MMSDMRNGNGSSIMPAPRYRDAPAAIAWLCSVLGFERRAVFTAPDGTVAHAELTLGGGMVMLGSARDDEHSQRFREPAAVGGETATTYVVTPDVAAIHARAVAAGASIVKAPYDTDYGSREFCVQDPEGHTWTLGTYNPWTAPLA